MVECLTRDRGAPGSSLTSLTARHIYPSLVLVHPMKTRPCLTERLFMGRKESTQTNKQTNTASKDFLKKLGFLVKGLIFNPHHLHLTLTANKKNIFVSIYKIIVKIMQCLEYNQCSVSPQKWIQHSAVRLKASVFHV